MRRGGGFRFRDRFVGQEASHIISFPVQQWDSVYMYIQSQKKEECSGALQYTVYLYSQYCCIVHLQHEYISRVRMGKNKFDGCKQLLKENTRVQKLQISCHKTLWQCFKLRPTATEFRQKLCQLKLVRCLKRSCSKLQSLSLTLCYHTQKQRKIKKQHMNPF